MLKSSLPRLLFFVLGFSLGLVLFSLFSTPQMRDTYSGDTVLDSIARALTGIEDKTDRMFQRCNKSSENKLSQSRARRKPFKGRSLHAHNRTKLADTLFSQVRVLCWIMTHKDNLPTKAAAVRDTWARRCHVVLFVSDEEDEEFPTIPVNISSGRAYLGEKTLAAFQYIYDHHFQDADWFLKADDDTYVIMENLRYLLSSQSSSRPIYFGHPFRPWVNQGYFSGGSGYVISKEALRRFGSRQVNAKPCHSSHGGSEDVMFGRCMEYLGVKVGESRDRMGRSRFHAMDLGTHLTGGFPDWYFFYDVLHGQSGEESISDYAISFHYVKPKEMLMFEFLVYRLHAYGILHGTQDLNLPSMNITWL